MGALWWLWAAFLIVLMLPTSYVWGKRGWGLPLPLHRRSPALARRGARADELFILLLLPIVWLVGLIAIAFAYR